MLRLAGGIGLPEHRSAAGFGAVAYYAPDLLLIPHPGNNAVEIVNSATLRFERTIGGLQGACTATAHSASGRAFVATCRQGLIETVLMPFGERAAGFPVGGAPYCLYLAGDRGLLLVGDRAESTVALVELASGRIMARAATPGPIAAAIWDPSSARFYCCVPNPSQVLILDPNHDGLVLGGVAIPSAGPRSIGLDSETGRLFCACDAGTLFAISVGRHTLVAEVPLAGVAGGLALDASRRRIFVALPEPGVLAMHDADSLALLQTAEIERGADSLGFDPVRGRLFVLLPGACRAAVFEYEG